MPFRKKLTLLAFVVACCFWKSAFAHAGIGSSRLPNSNVNEFGVNVSIPTPIGAVGGGWSWQTTDPIWHTQSAIKLWQQARKDFLKAPESNRRYAEYLGTVEQQLRVVLFNRLAQNPLPFPSHQFGQTPPKIAYAQLAVTQTLETLKALSEEVQQGSDPDKALQGMLDLINAAESELNEIVQNPNAHAQHKAQWESFVKVCDQPQKVAQALKNQALSSHATKEDSYRYALHLLAYELCPKTDGEIVNHFLKATQAGHEDAAFKLLEIYQPQVVRPIALSDVFFQLSQLQSNGQSPFQPQVCTDFLARAILVENEEALRHLNRKIQADIKQGVRKKDTDTRWQAWRALAGQLQKLATADEAQGQVQALINDVNDMYQEKNGKRKLALLSQMDDFPQSDSDEEPVHEDEAVKSLEDKNQRLTEALQQAQFMSETLAQEKKALATQLQINTSERSQQAEQLQASQNQCETLIEEIKASQAELSQKKGELLQRQNSGERKEQRIAELEAQLKQLQQAQQQRESQAKASCLPQWWRKGANMAPSEEG